MERSADIPVGNVRVKSMHPKKFAMWLFLITVTMIFVSLTSAYIVKRAEGNWLLIEFPSMFQWTSAIIIISSVSMQMAYIFAKHNNLLGVRASLLGTALLAVAFIVGQFMSWGQLVNQDVFFVGNPAGSFIYVFTGLHVAHLVGGVIFLIIVLINAFRYKVHSKSMVQIEMCATYWHFLGGLWLYLYLFLILNN
ncbi:cytochrome c oxidase subunit 3 [Marinoscillum furvescens]|uniref:Cytochrome c oxidase subunit 3 n=1 Tax=Marinoscillum furvescens DSM 4134 TaxID=1122208 RepID=A0A3D9L250_MARFU|nr:cytochrome c oxidase subunit 3 [Marinoscillum furvescens]RED96236.1 cytochrome c oxidase subunit 3 [Marinoscillum furvescens DSM 4134]